MTAGICHSERSEESRHFEMKKILRFAQDDSPNSCCREHNTDGARAALARDADGRLKIAEGQESETGIW
jgi:hypothetical protein